MKKFLVVSTVIFVAVTLSSFTQSSPYFSTKSDLINKINQQEQTVKAFIKFGDNWRSGQITYRINNNGLQPISYQFEELGNLPQLKGQFSPDQKFIPLNSNNIGNNKVPNMDNRMNSNNIGNNTVTNMDNRWTHSISVQGATAYLTLN